MAAKSIALAAISLTVLSVGQNADSAGRILTLIRQPAVAAEAIAKWPRTPTVFSSDRRLYAEPLADGVAIIDAGTLILVQRISSPAVHALLWKDHRTLVIQSGPRELRWVDAIGGSIRRSWRTTADIAGFDLLAEGPVVGLKSGYVSVFSWSIPAATRSWTADAGAICGIAASPNMKQVAVSACSGGVRLWPALGGTAATDEILRSLPPLTHIAVSNDARYVAGVMDRDNFFLLLADRTRKVRRVLPYAPRGVSVDRDSSAERDFPLRLIQEGERTQMTNGSQVWELPNATLVWHTGYPKPEEKRECLWQQNTGGPLFSTCDEPTFRSSFSAGRPFQIPHVAAVSPYPTRILDEGLEVAAGGSRVHFTEATSGREIAVLQTGVDRILTSSVLDNDRVAVSDAATIEVWNWRTSSLQLRFAAPWDDFQRSLTAPRNYVQPIRLIFGAGDSAELFWRDDRSLLRYSSKTGLKTTVCSFESPSRPNMAVGEQYALMVNGKEWTRCELQTGKVERGQFRDLDGAWLRGRFILHKQYDSQWLDVFDPEQKRDVLHIIAYPDGDWFAYTPEGWWDSNNSSRKHEARWRLDYKNLDGQPDYDIVDFLQVRHRFRSGLIEAVFEETLKREPGPDFGPRPRVAIAVQKSPTGKQVANVTATDVGGGVGTVTIAVNGAEQLSWKAKDCRRSGTRSYVCSFDLGTVAKGRVRFGNNIVEASATEETGQIVTLPVSAMWRPSVASARHGSSRPNPETEPTGTERRVFGLFVGTGKYGNKELNLPLPERDAEALGMAFQTAANSLVGGTANVRVEILTTSNKNNSHTPTKANIAKVMSDAREWLRGDDLFLLFLSGHGTSGEIVEDGIRRSVYYYPTTDATSFERSAETFRSVAISSDELASWLKDLPEKQVLIVDTCQAGGVADKALGKWRDASGDQRQALEDLKNGVGLFGITASRSDRLAYESSLFGHGLLTYALLKSVKEYELGGSGRIDVLRWFESSRTLVESLAKRIRSEQQPQVIARGRPFPIGIATKELRAKIQLRSEGLFLRIPKVNFGLSTVEDPGFDGLIRRELLDAVRNRESQGVPIDYFDMELTADDAVVPRVSVQRRGDAFTASFSLANAEVVVPEVNLDQPFRTREELAKALAAAIVDNAVEHTKEFRRQP